MVDGEKKPASAAEEAQVKTSSSSYTEPLVVRVGRAGTVTQRGIVQHKRVTADSDDPPLKEKG